MLRLRLDGAVDVLAHPRDGSLGVEAQDQAGEAGEERPRPADPRRAVNEDGTSLGREPMNPSS